MKTINRISDWIWDAATRHFWLILGVVIAVELYIYFKYTV